MVGIFPPDALARHFPTFVVVLSGLLILALALVERSHLGRVFTAIRDNENVVRSVGIRAHLMKVVCFCIASFVTGVAGSLHAFANNVISPLDFGFLLSTFALAYLKVGGERHPLGPVAGAALLVLLASLAQSFGSSDHIFYGAAIVIAVLFMPDGITGMLSKWQDRSGPGTAGCAAWRRTMTTTVDRIVPLRGQGLTRRFGGLVAVSELDLEIRENEILGLIGPNGAGKSTTFNLISGFYQTDPRTSVHRRQGRDRREPERISRMGLVRTFQHGSLMRTMTVEDNILVGAIGGMPGSTHEQRLHAFAKPPSCSGLPGFLKEPAGNLPHGVQRLVSIAIAFAPRPRLLCLDEPLTGLNQTEVASTLEVLPPNPARVRQLDPAWWSTT